MNQMSTTSFSIDLPKTHVQYMIPMKKKQILKKGQIVSSIKVEKLNGESSADHIVKTMSRINGINEVLVLLPKKEIIVYHDVQIDLLSIKKKIKELGYTERVNSIIFDTVSQQLKLFMFSIFSGNK